MSQEYCRICGFGNQYSLKKPVFCGGCGKNLNTSFASNTKPTISIPKVTVVVEEEIQEDVLDNLNIDIGLEYTPSPKEVVKGINGILAMGDPGNETFQRPIPKIKGKNQLKARQAEIVTKLRQKIEINQD